MPLPFILGGLALVAAGYGVKKGIDALDADCEADEFIKKAENLKEESTKKAESAESDCRRAFMRFGKKKLHVLSHSVSNFLNHFHRLNRSRITIGTKDTDMQDIQKQVLDARKITNQYREVDFFDVSGAVAGSAIGGVLAAYGAYAGVGMLASTAGGVAIAELSGVAATNATLAWLGGGALSVGGFGMVGGMAVLGGLVAGPALAILGAFSASKMEEKLENAKAYCSQVEKAAKEADAVIDNLQAIRKMADLFTRQITKFDALFFSLAQDAIATMKKHNYDTSRYNQKERDQLCVTVSTLMTLSAFLKVSIMDKHQKLNEKAQKALILMRDQVNAIESAQESGHYNVAMIQSKRKGLENL
ncbi:glycine zipper family protein [Helicobacter pylori]|uniref:glycine zipper family protein n=1 Tax=Helicobacter pylori TaxID=210 RepID=UPI000EAB990F|nr:glycine zipper family protein [Helicobacter pylori]RKV26562.1 glycine zipper family protein [Helicobacter pylori]RKV54919.1 glycine zipper family protein [Helicobacter pylori]WQX62970.1 glycine zipper family protein [Helicobacter pylori]WRA71577.1 glycine zipper family protein [Helicobacter pylori]